MDTNSPAGPGVGGTPTNLDVLGTTVTDGLVGLSAAFVPFQARRAAALCAKGAYNEKNRIGTEGRWHYSRAIAQAQPLCSRCGDCGQVGSITFQNTVTGEIVQAQERCGSKVCQECIERYAKKLQFRLWHAVKAHNDAEKARDRIPWLVTFTVRHSGMGAGVDSKRLQGGWARFRSDWYSRFGYTFTYFRALEVTEGRDEWGHAHWHCIIWMPDWIPMADMHRWWRKALVLSDAENGVTWETEEKAADAGSLHFRAIKDTNGAVKYITKACRYVAKNSIAFRTLPTAAATELLDALYGRRQIAGSVGLWGPKPVSEWMVIEVEKSERDDVWGGAHWWWHRGLASGTIPDTA